MFYRETEFKDTEIGKIPKDWDVRSLSKVAIIKGRIGWHGLRDEDYLNEGDYYLVRGIDFENGRIAWDKCVYVSREWYERDPNIQLREGDILITKDGSIGKVAFVDKLPKKATLGTGIFLIRAKTNEYLPKYVFYIMQSGFFKRFIESLKAGSTLSHLYQKDLVKFKFPLPPLEEQRKIAEILSTIDKAIQKTNEIIARTERLKKGLMQELLTRGIIFGFMFDTNIFNRILDQNIPLDMLPKKLRYYVTHNQKDEIERSPDDNRKKELLRIFKAIKQEKIPTETTLWGISPWGESKWGAYGGLYDKLLKRIQKLDKEAGKKKSLENQSRDALIAETCILNNLVLVSEDENLRKVVEEFKGVAITFEQFLKGEYREFKDTEIGKIPKDWKVVRLGEKADVVSGFAFPVKYQGKKTGKYPFIKVNDLNFSQKYIVSADNYVDDSDLKVLRAKVFPPNTIIFPKIGMAIYLNKFRILKTWGTFDNNIAGVIPKGIEPEFLYYYFVGRIDLRQLAGRTTTPSIKKSVLESILIPLPPLEEQKKIAQILSTVDKKLEIEKKEKEKLERIKRGFMDLLLTGKVRVCL